ncbi:NAD-dependent epimerase/dehydratase family protein [Streptomyces sp. NBC_00989]|uniref:NAD-dependent epimerase/dehydratase family protein n=1 Tax=Streptomyces sp. NBC_00989 TaxID=2903705 RepID=UPI00386A6784|nr:NAD(P)-dependent oxidoreductase [Streptomyces sp. NBC_00989]
MTTNESNEGNQGNENSRSILLAGATGVLGRHITQALTDAGHKVTGLGRGPGNDVRADLMDRDGLLRAVDGQHFDTVIHAATALRKAPLRHRDMHATDALRSQGTAHLIEAARATGARRFLSESMVFGYGYGDFGTRPLTEDDPFGPRGTTPALEKHIEGMRTKEQLTLEAKDLEGIALRFGLFYGPGGTEALLSMLRRRQLPAPDDHGRVVPWVGLTDAARAVAAAVEHGCPGQAYNIADRTPLGFRAHLLCAAREFGLPKPMAVPLWMVRPMVYAHTLMAGNLRVSSAKAERELGWTPVYASSGDGLAAMRAAR